MSSGIINPLGEPIASGQEQDQPLRRPSPDEKVSLNGVAVVAMCSDGLWRKFVIEQGVGNIIVNILKNQRIGLVLDSQTLRIKHVRRPFWKRWFGR